ncbi:MULTISPECIES: hypothetical protein [Burkholderia cepacia complex]|uniref:hypothetical protein n=1 Tax=Burkholderia cepacia complex TaxID=87882 RepID=UPI0011157697|nr:MULTISPECIES: hypothetical protein [Burkholderia cepacia complex]
MIAFSWSFNPCREDRPHKEFFREIHNTLPDIEFDIFEMPATGDYITLVAVIKKAEDEAIFKLAFGERFEWGRRMHRLTRFAQGDLL